MIQPFKNPTRRVVKNGARFDLKNELLKISPEKILLVTGSKSFRNSFHYNDLTKILSAYFFDSLLVQNAPTDSFIQREWDRLKTKGYDLVIGIGGGSVLDFGKTIAALLTQKEGTVNDFLLHGKKFAAAPLPFIALPTTSGTGSEVTQYASIETNDKQKISLSDPKLFPTAALVDPELTQTMPPYLTACTGFDAICQAIESYWSRNNTEWSEKHSLRAIPLLLRNLERVILKPTDSEARFQMAYASSEAGLAIAETKTTAVHSVSYPITTYFRVPHGHACALTLAPFIRFNAPSLKDERGTKLCEAMNVSSLENAAHLVEDLMKKSSLESQLAKLGITSGDFKVIIQNGFRPDRVNNNPRTLTPDELRTILKSIA